MNALRVWGGGIYESEEFYEVMTIISLLSTLLSWWNRCRLRMSLDYSSGRILCLPVPCILLAFGSWTAFLKKWGSRSAVFSTILPSFCGRATMRMRRPVGETGKFLFFFFLEDYFNIEQNLFMTSIQRYGTVSHFKKFRQDYVKLYVDTIRSIVAEEDPSRPFVVSSPSNGKESEEEGYVSINPYSNLYGDGKSSWCYANLCYCSYNGHFSQFSSSVVHYYNYYANAWNTSSLPRPRMATEYGFQSLPSVHAWAEATDQSEDWTYSSKLLENRQHHPMGNMEMMMQVTNRFGQSTAADPAGQFVDLIYLTQVRDFVVLFFIFNCTVWTTISISCSCRCTRPRLLRRRRNIIGGCDII